ncbi:MAG: type II CRISPR-associated endonuclease Cas1 [Euryarchaeota archaeon]|nr:type II CRISPR-associated endonuclease Cas1 [Euryarchaeota archaeon]
MSRVVHIGDNVARITVGHHQLNAETRSPEPKTHTAPLEDLDAVVLSTLDGLDLDLHTLVAAAQHSTAVIVCDDRFLPVGVLLPLFGAWNHTEILRAQIDASAPRRKRCWQQIVRQKIREQSRSLDPDSGTARRLSVLADEVRSGDVNNVEATAARLYWPALMGPTFRRQPGTRLGLNGALDYGYAIVRSLVARCAVGVGLHPALGVHHHSRTNPLCLADDLVEPLRPLVDRVVSSNPERFTDALDTTGKDLLRGLLELPVRCGEHRGLLATTCERYALSFRDCLTGETDTIEFPEYDDR